MFSSSYWDPSYWDTSFFSSDATPLAPTIRYDSPLMRRVQADWLIAGQVRVSWELDCRYAAAQPLSFQLQLSETGLQEADDWQDIGSPQQNVSFLTDTLRRPSGKVNRWHYRVKASDPLGNEDYSPIAHPYGLLNPRDWRLAREILRKELLRQKTFAGWQGWLLKRRERGEGPPPQETGQEILDPLTGEIIRPAQTDTYNTPYNQGFYAPFATYFDLTPSQHYPRRGGQGPADPQMVRARTPALPQLQHGDVFVHEGSDRRYVIRSVQHVAEFRGVPLVAECELRLLPFDDIVYEVPVP